MNTAHDDEGPKKGEKEMATDESFREDFDLSAHEGTYRSFLTLLRFTLGATVLVLVLLFFFLAR